MTRNEVKELGCDWQLMRRVVKTVFGQRRKMLRVSLKQMVPVSSNSASLYNSEYMTKRPEQLSVPQFIELTNLVDDCLAHTEQ